MVLRRQHIRHCEQQHIHHRRYSNTQRRGHVRRHSIDHKLADRRLRCIDRTSVALPHVHTQRAVVTAADQLELHQRQRGSLRHT